MVVSISHFPCWPSKGHDRAYCWPSAHCQHPGTGVEDAPYRPYVKGNSFSRVKVHIFPGAGDSSCSLIQGLNYARQLPQVCHVWGSQSLDSAEPLNCSTTWPDTRGSISFGIESENQHGCNIVRLIQNLYPFPFCCLFRLFEVHKTVVSYVSVFSVALQICQLPSILWHSWYKRQGRHWKAA